MGWQSEQGAFNAVAVRFELLLCVKQINNCIYVSVCLCICYMHVCLCFYVSVHVNVKSCIYVCVFVIWVDICIDGVFSFCALCDVRLCFLEKENPPEVSYTCCC